MDIPMWAYIVVGILAVAGFISIMWFSFFLDKSEKNKQALSLLRLSRKSRQPLFFFKISILL